jgi:hypothetical protein
MKRVRLSNPGRITTTSFQHFAGKRGGAATKSVGTSSAGPRPNAVRPYIARKTLPKIKNLRYCNAVAVYSALFIVSANTL